MLRAHALDHLVLKVADVRRSTAWYRDVLGLEPLRLEAWERGEVLFVSLRVDEGTIIDLLEGEPDGVNVDHVCLVVDATPAELGELVAAEGLEPLGPPAELYGARGTGTSVYVRDPDGHVVELRAYPS